MYALSYVGGCVRAKFPGLSTRRICAVEYYYVKHCSFTIRVFHGIIYKVFDFEYFLRFRNFTFIYNDTVKINMYIICTLNLVSNIL